MSRVHVAACVLLLNALVACASQPEFPPELVVKVDHNITFQELTANPAFYIGRTVQLGGQIVASEVNGRQVSMLVRELPIRTEPVYGPVDTGKFRGMLVIRYIGQIGPQDLQHGNMIVVIGSVEGSLSSNLTGTTARRLTVAAECVHIWRTQGDAIEDFPWLAHTRYWPLIQQTYCYGKSDPVLQVS